MAICDGYPAHGDIVRRFIAFDARRGNCGRPGVLSSSDIFQEDLVAIAANADGRL